MNGCEFINDVRNVTMTSAALKLMHQILNEHLEDLSRGGKGTEWGIELCKDLQEVIQTSNDGPAPLAQLSVFVHAELMETLRDFVIVVTKSTDHITFDNPLEETFAHAIIKERT